MTTRAKRSVKSQRIEALVRDGRRISGYYSRGAGDTDRQTGAPGPVRPGGAFSTELFDRFQTVREGVAHALAATVPKAHRLGGSAHRGDADPL